MIKVFIGEELIVESNHFEYEPDDSGGYIVFKIQIPIKELNDTIQTNGKRNKEDNPKRPV